MSKYDQQSQKVDNQYNADIMIINGHAPEGEGVTGIELYCKPLSMFTKLDSLGANDIECIISSTKSTYTVYIKPGSFAFLPLKPNINYGLTLQLPAGIVSSVKQGIVNFTVELKEGEMRKYTYKANSFMFFSGGLERRG